VEGLQLVVSIFRLQLVFRKLQHIKEVFLVFRGRLDSRLLGFRLANQIPKGALLQQLLVLPVIGLGLLGRIKCPVLRLAFRVAIDITSLASAGRGLFI